MADDRERELTPERVRQMLDGDEIQLVDVRRDDEWEAGRVPGAVHIELAQLGERGGEIDQGRPVVFMCLVGKRSALAMQAFLATGHDAYNLSGGIRAWSEQGLPTDPADATFDQSSND